MLKNLRRRLATMLYPDVLADVEVKATSEKFDKNGWTPWTERLPKFDDFPIHEMRDGWRCPSEMDWQTNALANRSTMSLAGLWWRPARLGTGRKYTHCARGYPFPF